MNIPPPFSDMKGHLLSRSFLYSSISFLVLLVQSMSGIFLDLISSRARVAGLKEYVSWSNSVPSRSENIRTLVVDPDYYAASFNILGVK